MDYKVWRGMRFYEYAAWAEKMQVLARRPLIILIANIVLDALLLFI